MRKFLIAALVAAGPAIAGTEMVAGYGQDEIRIYDQKCEIASVLRHIQEDKRKDFRKARAKVNGQTYFACWVQLSAPGMPPSVALIYEDGDIGMIPVEHFKDPVSI
jgi:hypothetical protein